MLSPVLSRRRWKLFAHGQHIVVAHGEAERFVHPLMKAFIWALYLPEYPTATIEVSIGDRYKPDVVAFADIPAVYEAHPQPEFWGEAGRTGKDKINDLARRFLDTHFVIGKWDTRLEPHIEIVSAALDGISRNAPFDLISFPESTVACVDDRGAITIDFDDVEFVRL